VQDVFLSLGECRRQKWSDLVIRARYLQVVASRFLTRDETCSYVLLHTCKIKKNNKLHISSRYVEFMLTELQTTLLSSPSGTNCTVDWAVVNVSLSQLVVARLSLGPYCRTVQVSASSKRPSICSHHRPFLSLIMSGSCTNQFFKLAINRNYNTFSSCSSVINVIIIIKIVPQFDKWQSVPYRQFFKHGM